MKLATVVSLLNDYWKQAIVIFQIGTALEYFDLMLYVHMAVLLNELFFPQTDPHTTSLLTALALCSLVVMRPAGALIFGWVSNNLGRRATIILTTTLLSGSCIVMAILPTYARIGITASWIVTLCRMTQGMSAMGDTMGAQIYLSETIFRPASFPAVTLITIASDVGGVCALALAVFVTSYSLNWRYAFWMGAIIALAGVVARTRLREIPEFLKVKKQHLKTELEKLIFGWASQGAGLNARWKEYVNYKILTSFFAIYCGWPLCFYLVYIYFNPVLIAQFGYSSVDIIKHNFLLAIIGTFLNIFWVFLGCRFHPLKIIKARGGCALLLMVAIPFAMVNINNPSQLFVIQALILAFALSDAPAAAVLLFHLPVYSRFTYANFLLGLTRALIYVVTSFGLIYLNSYFGPYGLWFIALPITLAYLAGISHFVGLEQQQSLYVDPEYKFPHIKTMVTEEASK